LAHGALDVRGRKHIYKCLQCRKRNNAYNAASGTWKNHVNFSGFVYFTYTFQTAVVLPINWVKATGKRDGKSIKIEWAIKTNEDIDAFELDRSTDGKTWENIAQLDKNKRQFIDNDHITKAIYYRIKAKILRGGIETSPVISVESMALNVSINAFPNPFNDIINLPELPLEKIELFNIEGQKQLISVVNHQINGLNHLPEGVYILKTLTDGLWQDVKMIKEK
jgi:Secretion system C-terminal sorting domain